MFIFSLLFQPFFIIVRIIIIFKYIFITPLLAFEMRKGVIIKTLFILNLAILLSQVRPTILVVQTATHIFLFVLIYAY